MTASESEQEKLSCEEACQIAKDLRANDGVDPLKHVPEALLSSDHIEECVLKTGAISPFVIGGERNRLKKASYEARIGKKGIYMTKIAAWWKSVQIHSL